MKKQLTLFTLILALCFSLAACGGATKEEAATTEAPSAPAASESAPAASSESNTQQNEEASPVENAEEEKEEASQAPEGEGDLGSYHVAIKGAKKSEDYEGKPVIIITYEWTNNSDDTTSAMGSMLEQAFQDGVQMDTGIVTEEINESYTQVRPGTTVKVDAVYCLTSDSTVEFELSALEDMFSSDTPKVTMNFEPNELD